MKTPAASPATLLEAARQALGSVIIQSGLLGNEVFLLVVRDQIADVMRLLRDDHELAMTQLMDVCGVDYPERQERFEVVYHLLSLKHNARLRMKVRTDEKKPVPSVAAVYSAAGWFEREVWDLFGVRFDHHPDLRRILTDYDFEGHPLRKDFPLEGHVEARYDLVEKKVKYGPVRLAQPFRDFSRQSPWKGMTDVMAPPLPEKSPVTKEES